MDVKKELLTHIGLVAKHLGICREILRQRAEAHDMSKFEEPEYSIFAEHMEQLGKHEFGSQEYEALREKMKPALDHHYACNSHHPEPGAIEDMNLFDVAEMICDWMSASKRHPLGNIEKSVKVCEARFKIEPQLACVIRNTISAINKEYFDATN